MSLAKYFEPGRLALSYELFPPKTAKGEENLYANVQQLMEFSPDFVTCTYGAGGSTQDKTLEIVSEVQRRFEVPVASHLTVVGSTVDQLREYLRRAQLAGVAYIVALRGDPPQGETEFVPTAGGLRYANELVTLIRDEFPDFGVLVAGYPETHREAPSPETDLENLKMKVDAGADVVVTQLFYDNEDYFRFRDRCLERGIEVPIVPGILPITSLPQVERIAALCGSRLPQRLVERLRERDDAAWHFEVGVEWAIEQTRGLIEVGVPGLHFYVLNQSPATLRILRELRAETIRGSSI
ncbi:MAG: methylenetetrahydrofolate reductase [NAD(P)H] [Pirellulaceae bacterium]|nr:methylenetetrahydrofolate reductase [NAD(P)H] [Pirellulaceae bacterium]